MSTEQQENLEAALRRSPTPVGSSVSEQRRLLRGRASARSAPADVTVNFYPLLDEAADALDRAGQLLTMHLASAARVTA